MRRLLFVFLLVLMPLQSIWAAAADYCSHEETPATMHWGHHVHQHQGDQPTDEGDMASLSAMAIDLDCHSCHGSSCALHPGAGPALQEPGATHPLPWVVLSLTVPSLQRPERPPNAPALA